MGGGLLTSPTTEYAYDKASNLRFITDPLGNVTEYVYDARNRRITEVLPDPDGAGSLTSPEIGYAYDDAGQLTSVTDPLGRVTSYQYDALGRMISVTLPDPDGAGGQAAPETTYAYDAASRLVSMTDALGNVTQYDYDVLDHQIAVTLPDPDGAGSLTSPVIRYEYDAAGQLLEVFDPLDRNTSHEYDNLGRRKKTTLPDPDGAGSATRPFSTFTYDAASNLQTVTDPLSHVTDYDYDNLYRRTKITDAETGETTFTYDAAGRMLSLTDPVSNTTEWEYDKLGRVIEETNELAEIRTFKYDAVGNLTERIDRLGRKIVWEYDNLYRNTAEKWYDGANLVRTLSFTFDAASQLTAASDPAASYGYTLDNLGRVTSDTQTITGLTFDIEYQSQYNANGRRTQLLAVLDGTADFKNTYLYDNLSRLTGLNQQDTSGGSVVADKRIDFAYNAASQYTQVTRYADISGFEFVANTFYTYDGLGRLSKLLHTEDATAPGSGWGTDPLAGYVYAYDAASRITSIDSYVDGTTTYTHDDTDQLTGADHASITDESYSYDANGNRTMTGYSTGTNNQLTTDGTRDYEYDDEGNRSAKEKISTGEREELTWDHRNRLTKVEFKNSGGTVVKSVDFAYDAFNRLIRRTVDPDGTTGSAALVDTIFSWENDQINLQFDGSSASDLTHRNLWSDAVDQILAVEDVSSLTSAGDVKWPFSDHLGTPRDLATYNATTDDTSVSNHRIFDSFGKLISETNGSFTIAIGFTGVFFEVTTSLNYHRNRWYDMNSGRWVTEDPIGFAAGDENLKRYVGNHPTYARDPSGLDEPLDTPYARDFLAKSLMQADPATNKIAENGVISISGHTVMNALDFYQFKSVGAFGFGKTETDEYKVFEQGCKGLASLRLNLGGKEPFTLPRTRAFKTIGAALVAQRKMLKDTPKSHRVVIWVYQSDLYLNDQFDDLLLPDSQSEYDSTKIISIRGPIPNLPRKASIVTYDFVTVHQNDNCSIRFYETMDFGVTRNPDLVVKHKLKLYPPTAAGTAYFVVPIPDHPRAPLSPLGEKTNTR